MHTTRSRLTVLLAAAVLALGVSACGSDSDASTDAQADAEPAATVPVESDAPAGNNEGAVETDDNPLVLGYEVSGPAGTIVEITSVVDVGGGETQEMETTMELADEPEWQMFTNWVQGVELTLDVTEGGPATITGFRGNYVNVDNPFDGYVIAEDLGSAELPSGAVTTFGLP
jgi:hypothetical protein